MGLIENRFEENVLTIRGEKHAETRDEKTGWHVRERSAGKFQRRLALPTEVEADAVTATAKNGVVTIRLPKPPEVQPQTRTIPVTSD